jgi:hypothetical protein
MDLGIPPDMTWYKFLVDLGSFIAGIFALIAGVVAYIAGKIQANATIEASRIAHLDANREFNALQAQAEQARQSATEELLLRDRDLVRSLGIEAVRIKRLAEDRLGVARLRYPGNPADHIHREYQPYIIEAGDVLRGQNAMSLRGTGILPAATELFAKVEVLNSALISAAAFSLLTVNALFGHLNNVIHAATALQDRVVRWQEQNAQEQ